MHDDNPQYTVNDTPHAINANSEVTQHDKAPSSLNNTHSIPTNDPVTVTQLADGIVPLAPAASQLPSDTLLLNDLIVDSSLKWQIHNCKITDQTLTQEATLPFLYHYDTLSDELKSVHPLTPPLLMRFNEPMTAQKATEVLNLPKGSIPTPWQVKIVGTLVMFCESLQIAVRLRFTNSSKALEPIYTSDESQALIKAMESWHFFGDVFVLNKCPKPLAVASTDTAAMTNDDIASDPLSETPVASAQETTPHDNGIILIAKSDQYQFLTPTFAVALLTELETHKMSLPQIDDAVQQRLK